MTGGSASHGNDAHRRNRKRKQSADKHHPPPHPKKKTANTAAATTSPAKTVATAANTSTTSAAAAKKRRGDHDTSRLAPVPEEERVCGVALTFGSGDTGQLGLGEDVLDRKKPSLAQGDQMGTDVVQVGFCWVFFSREGALPSFCREFIS